MTCRYPVLLALAVLALAGTEQGALRNLDAAAHSRAAIDAHAAYGIDPVLLVAVAWEESRFRADVVSRVGACGALGVVPRFVRGVSCADLGDVGVAYLTGARVLWRWREFCEVAPPLACYNGGEAPGRAARQYAARVERTARWLRAWMTAASAACEVTP